MTDNILIFSDTHIYHSHAKSKPQADGYSVRESEHLDVANSLAESIKKHKPACVVFCGDLCHELSQVSVRCLTVAIKFVKIIASACKDINAELYLLVGNHDIGSVNSNTLDIFKFNTPPWVHIIDQFLVQPLNGFVFLPYVQNADNAKEFIDNISLDERKDYIVFSHVDIKGADYGGGLLASRGLSVSDLSGFKHVFQGHYHVPQDIGESITVVGSPQRWGFKDAKSRLPRGYCLYKNGKVIRFALKDIGDWLTYTDENIGDILTLDNKSSNYVRLEISSDAILDAFGITSDFLSQFKGYEIQLDVARIGSVKRRNSSIDNDVIHAESNEEVLAEIISLREELSDSEKEALKAKGGKLLAKYNSKKD